VKMHFQARNFQTIFWHMVAAISHACSLQACPGYTHTQPRSATLKASFINPYIENETYIETM
jgi:hypothetical protein